MTPPSHGTAMPRRSGPRLVASALIRFRRSQWQALLCPECAGCARRPRATISIHTCSGEIEPYGLDEIHRLQLRTGDRTSRPLSRRSLGSRKPAALERLPSLSLIRSACPAQGSCGASEPTHRSSGVRHTSQRRSSGQRGQTTWMQINRRVPRLADLGS